MKRPVRSVLDIGRETALQMTLQKYATEPSSEAGATPVVAKSSGQNETTNQCSMSNKLKGIQIMNSQNNYDIRNVFPSRLKGEDLEGAEIVTIERVELKEFEDQKTKQPVLKPIVHFTDERFIHVNPTQGRALATITGQNDIRKWAGATIMIAPLDTQLGKSIAISKPPASTMNGKRAKVEPEPTDQDMEVPF